MSTNQRRTMYTKVIIALVTTLVVAYLLSIVPRGAAGEIGSSSSAYGIPFEFYSTTTPSYPNAVTTTQFRAEMLIANVVIVGVVVAAVVYLVGRVTSRRKQ